MYLYTFSHCIILNLHLIKNAFFVYHENIAPYLHTYLTTCRNLGTRKQRDGEFLNNSERKAYLSSPYKRCVGTMLRELFSTFFIWYYFKTQDIFVIFSRTTSRLQFQREIVNVRKIHRIRFSNRFVSCQDTHYKQR